MQASEPSPQRSRLKCDHDRPPAAPAVLGLLVADSSLKRVLSNHEAIAILTYPGPPSQNLADALRKKVAPGLFNNHKSPSGQNVAHPAVELKSGRRTYFCRAFVLNSNGKDRDGTATLLVLERGSSRPVASSHISQQFNFTHREQQAVTLLLEGLSNKEMAQNMGISENTVKAYLRMAAIKMGVASRLGIVTRILSLVLDSNGSELNNGRHNGKLPQA